MNKKNLVSHSKQLSLVLRHQPDRAGVTLDPQGWASVDDLLRGLAAARPTWNAHVLNEVVVTNDKRRFEFSPDGTRIRARQGHSIEVDLALTPTSPPEVLLHGTVSRYLEQILEEGLKPMNRHHVHLSADLTVATKVGSRRGRPIVLKVNAAGMADAGSEFFVTENGVWLVDHVPPKYLRLLD